MYTHSVSAMKSTPEEKRRLPEGSIDAERQLPYSGHKIERMSLQARGLVDDVREWVDLKVKLVQVEIEDKIDEKVNQAVVAAALVFVIGLALVFALTALSLGLGTILGHDAWGFLSVAGLLALIAGGIQIMKPRMLKKSTPAAKKQPEPPSAALKKTNP